MILNSNRLQCIDVWMPLNQLKCSTPVLIMPSELSIKLNYPIYLDFFIHLIAKHKVLVDDENS